MVNQTPKKIVKYCLLLLRIHINKAGIRSLGIAESFSVNERKSTIAGVVMRADLVIDGVGFTSATLGGFDATEKIVKLYKSFKRNDINLVILSGCIISYYNIVDLEYAFKKIGRPIICLTYKESRGIEETIKAKFSNDQRRLELYRKLGEREKIILDTGKTVYHRSLGLSPNEVNRLLNIFTIQGTLPEPVRVAKLVARSAKNYLKESS